MSRSASLDSDPAEQPRRKNRTQSQKGSTTWNQLEDVPDNVSHIFQGRDGAIPSPYRG